MGEKAAAGSFICSRGFLLIARVLQREILTEFACGVLPPSW
jgi:hypothetical protein